MNPVYVDKEIYGQKFKVVEPVSIGFGRHTTAEFDDHEPVLEQWVRGIRRNDVCVDAGAQFGNYTLPALRIGARVYAYEPFFEAAEILRTNIEVNGFGKIGVVRQVALWDGTPYPQDILKQLFSGMQVPDWPTVRLSDDLRIDALDVKPGKVHMKLDVEGAELGVLIGARQLIRDWHPRIIIEDHEGVSKDPNCAVSNYPIRVDSRKRMEEMLVGFGYSITRVPFDVSRWYWVCE